MANFKRNSRYSKGLVATNRSNKPFLVLRRPLALEPSEDDTFIVVTQEYTKRPELLSSKVYGTPELWWVIYEFNGIMDPLFDLKIDQVLRIPSLDRVVQAIQNIEE